MITIVEPKDHIARLWGKQQIRESDTYRLMRYVLRVDHEGKVLLHNVVTGQLVVLEQEEADALDKLPSGYHPVMEQLVTEHYLVPEGFDEHQETINLRTILRRLDGVRKKPIIHYTILVTTGCNARCYYCYERGIKISKMSEQTAEDVVQYIASHRDEHKRVYITWFGGEPTTATDRIDQICCRLKELGIDYQSDIVTNAYAFDKDMVAKAKDLWKLTFAQIAVDGVGKSYNTIKAYVAAKDDPYERVMRNIGLLLENGISVEMRMNFSPQNYTEFEDLIQEAKTRFNNHPLLSMTAHAVITDFVVDDNTRDYGSEKWLESKLLELNNQAREAGTKRIRKTLPSLSIVGCEADNDTTVGINCDGKLLRCLEQLDDSDTIGSISEGITNTQLAASWKEVLKMKPCRECVLFPYCLRMKNCHGGNRCLSAKERPHDYTESARCIYKTWLSHNQ